MNNATAACNAELNAFAALLSNGTLVIYSGTRPATANTALGLATALVTFTFNATAFSAPTTLSSSIQAITGSFVSNTVTSTAVGSASFARAFTSTSTAVADFSVSTSGADINLATISIVPPATVTLPTFLITMSNG